MPTDQTTARYNPEALKEEMRLLGIDQQTAALITKRSGNAVSQLINRKWAKEEAWRFAICWFVARVIGSAGLHQGRTDEQVLQSFGRALSGIEMDFEDMMAVAHNYKDDWPDENGDNAA